MKFVLAHDQLDDGCNQNYFTVTMYENISQATVTLVCLHQSCAPRVASAYWSGARGRTAGPAVCLKSISCCIKVIEQRRKLKKTFMVEVS